jgi:hypothetical protein
MSHTFTVVVTDEEYRAMELIMPSPDDWVNHAVTWRAYKCLIDVAQRSIEQDKLSSEDQLEVQQDLTAEGTLLSRKDKWSMEVLKKITTLTSMKTRVERDAEELGIQE